MNIRALILKKIKKGGQVAAADIIKSTGFSRAYVNRFFRVLQNEGKITLVGKANKAVYVSSESAAVTKAKKKILRTRRVLHNRNLSEDAVLDEVKRDTGVFLDLPRSVTQILEYAFTEMLNNAIEHSRSREIEISMEKNKNGVKFSVVDRGIGIFKNIMLKKGLKNELEAIQELLKGKQTTAPKEHTGEGVFFTSKAANVLTIQSTTKILIFNNIIKDVFIKSVKRTKGTRVIFYINIKSKRNLNKIFREYAGDAFEFSKTRVIIRLYRMDNKYISRSQARRVVTGLEKFKQVILDFSKIDTMGQAFADEIFRVWKARHPNIEIKYEKANQNIEFMIKRACG